MQKLKTLLLLMVGFGSLQAQNFDLIVNTNGDSIACHIDSLTDTHIYFRMKMKNNWIHTSMDRKSMASYTYQSINKKTLVFRPGTSYLQRFRSTPASMWDVRRNSIALETNVVIYSLYYGRLFPVTEGIGITAGAGLNYFLLDVTFVTLESTLLLGGPKHFFEPGIKYYYAKKDDTGLYLDGGYRFQGTNGFIFRAYLGFALTSDEEIEILPVVGIGYSF